jgi:threonine/homoserine/homoserine lactone efflux protein
MSDVTMNFLDVLATLICIGFLCLLVAIACREVSIRLERRRPRARRWDDADPSLDREEP